MLAADGGTPRAIGPARLGQGRPSRIASVMHFQGKENEMIAHRWILAALCASLLMVARHAAAETDEVVVYGKRSEAMPVVDEAAARVDVDRERRALGVSLERALAADPKPKAERVATAPTRPRG